MTLLAFGYLAGLFGYPEHEEPSPSFDASLGGFLNSPRRVSVVIPRSFEDTQELADCFKRQQLVIVNLRSADRKLSKRMVDFCAGLTYALGGRICPIADQLFLLTPHDAEVLDEGGEQLAKQAFFNQL